MEFFPLAEEDSVVVMTDQPQERQELSEKLGAPRIIEPIASWKVSDKQALEQLGFVRKVWKAKDGRTIERPTQQGAYGPTEP